MAFDKYKNAAWQEPEEGVRRYDASAWTNCEAAKRYKNSAWEEVWSDIKIMTLESNTISGGYLSISPDGPTTFPSPMLITGVPLGAA